MPVKAQGNRKVDRMVKAVRQRPQAGGRRRPPPRQSVLEGRLGHATRTVADVRSQGMLAWRQLVGALCGATIDTTSIRSGIRRDNKKDFIERLTFGQAFAYDNGQVDLF